MLFTPCYLTIFWEQQTRFEKLALPKKNHLQYHVCRRYGWLLPCLLIGRYHIWISRWIASATLSRSSFCRPRRQRNQSAGRPLSSAPWAATNCTTELRLAAVAALLYQNIFPKWGHYCHSDIHPTEQRIAQIKGCSGGFVCVVFFWFFLHYHCWRGWKWIFCLASSTKWNKIVCNLCGASLLYLRVIPTPLLCNLLCVLTHWHYSCERVITPVLAFSLVYLSEQLSCCWRDSQSGDVIAPCRALCVLPLVFLHLHFIGEKYIM